jgi:hypothetical protein
VTITVAATRQRVLDLELRMPFHFGETTIRDLPHLFVSVELSGEFDGATGVASENLSPTWFLSNVGPLSLQQDLAVMATLGVDHLERNGHHYFRGMSMLPPAVQTALLSAHDDLYRRHEEGIRRRRLTGTTPRRRRVRPRRSLARA